jgi:hypothetical protein
VLAHRRYVLLLWNSLLVLAPAFMAAMLLGSPVFLTHQLPAMTGVMVSGLLAYCVLFAVNSSVHSFLIVKWVQRARAPPTCCSCFCCCCWLGRGVPLLCSWR